MDARITSLPAEVSYAGSNGQRNLNGISIADLPGVAAIRDMSDWRKARALVRFLNGRAFLVTWDVRAQRFEVSHWTTDLESTSTNSEGVYEPCDDRTEVISYLTQMSQRIFPEHIQFLPLEFEIERQMSSR